MDDGSALGFGERLRRHRLAAGLTQEELAERARLSPAAVSTLERGARHAPRRETVALLARALRLSPEEHRTLAAAVSRRRGPARSGGAPVEPAPLPVPLSSFVGRERERSALAALLAPQAARLVTLIGPGGSGKTRLAVEAAARAAPAYRTGAAFVSLAAVGEPALVLPTLAQALRLRLLPNRPLLDQLRGSLAGSPRLLVLDNVEQVAECAVDLAALLGACPQLTLLVTSRVPLRVSGERVVPVAPLALHESTAAPERLLHVDAVQLFAERARAQVPDFVLGPAEAPLAADLVRRLDGLPLAIELAAARLRVLPLGALLARLHSRLPLLVGGPRDLPERQRTLRATIDWSHDLLAAEERRLFRRLAVFAGGFSLEAAEAVAREGAVAAGELDTLEALVAQSLLERDDAAGGEEPRFRMLETIREYAQERLEQSGEAPATRDRHAAYFLALAEAGTAASAATWDEGLDWGDERLALLGAEIANLRAAVSWALASGARETALRLCGALAWFWWIVGPWAEGRRALEQALALPGDAAPGLRARAHRALARFMQPLGEQGNGEAEAHTEQALALMRAAGDLRGVGWLLLHQGGSAQHRGDTAAAEGCYQEALAALASVGDRRGMARAQLGLAALAAGQGRHPAADASLAAARAAFQDLGDQRGEADVLFTIGGVYRDAGCIARAQPLLEQAVARFRRLHERNTLGLALTSLGDVRRRLGDLAGARAILEEAVAQGNAVGAPQLLRFAHYILWQLTLDTDDLAAARAQAATVLALDRELAGASTTSFVLAGAARLAMQAGCPERAARLLAAADAARRREGWPWPECDRLDFQPVREAARAALGDTGLAAAWTAGETLTAEAATAEVTALVAQGGGPAQRYQAAWRR